MCCAEFIVKYVLFGANLIFTLAGLALIGVGVAVLVQLREVLELIPVNVDAIPIAIIVLGSVIFVIAFFGCCGAIRESQCLIIMYFVCMGILAGCKIYLATVIFRALDDIENTVTGWIQQAFGNQNLREVFHVMETLFSCCGTTGPGSYDGVLPILPPSCCSTLSANNVCEAANAHGGCSSRLSDYFSTFGEVIGVIIISVIVVELVAMIFGMFMCWSIGNKRSRQRYY